MKYTSMIDLGSRPTLPRVDMTPLAAYLNIIETKKKIEVENSKQISEYDNRKQEIATAKETGVKINEDNLREETSQTFNWHCDRITDSGPILRLNSNINKLSKAARYGHPYERPIYPSLITPIEMKGIVSSFFTHAYTGGIAGKVKPKRDHEWCDLHEFNRAINWSTWTPLPTAIPNSLQESAIQQ